MIMLNKKMIVIIIVKNKINRIGNYDDKKIRITYKLYLKCEQLNFYVLLRKEMFLNISL